MIVIIELFVLIVILFFVIRSYILDKRSNNLVNLMSDGLDTFKQDIINNIDLYFENVVKPEVMSNDVKIQELQIKIASLEINNEILLKDLNEK